MPFTFRPPWPDELRRAAAFLQKETLGPGWHPRVWEVPRPARFVGAASWRLEPKNSAAHAVFQLLPRYHTPALALEMLRPLFAEIAAAGAATVHLSLASREPWENLLRPFGLHWTHTGEFWSIDAALARERLAQSRFHSRPDKTRGWSVRPLEEADWELVKTWAVQPGFFDDARLDFLRAHHSPDLSGAAVSPHGLAGLLVAESRGLTTVLAFIGGNPARPAATPIASHLLFCRLCATHAPAAPFDTLLMTTNPALDPAAHALARRFRMTLVSSRHHFSGSLDLSQIS